MSRSPEETQKLEERIRRMKLNSERLQRRHQEVEEDKLHAAQQNALVQTAPPPSSDWVIRRQPDNEYNDSKSPPTSPLEITENFGNFGNFLRGRGRGRGRGRLPDQRRSWNNEHDDRTEDEPQPRQRPDRGGQQYIRGAGRDRYSAPGTTPGTSPGIAPGIAPGIGNSPRSDSGNSDFRRTPRRGGRDGFNTSLDGPLHKGRYRLAEGDGPPPDPSFSYLTDSWRDANAGSGSGSGPGPGPDRRKDDGLQRAMPQRSPRGPPQERQNPYHSPRSSKTQQSYEEWRRERDAIDQRRIDRQKKSDGNWSREWDNDKIVQNDASPPRQSGGDSWDRPRRRYNNRFGDFFDESLNNRTRNRSNHRNESGQSDAKGSPETDGAREDDSHDRQNFRRRQPRRQLNNDGFASRNSYNADSEARRPAVVMSKPLNPSARLEYARQATGPVVSTLRQLDSDVISVTMPSSASPVSASATAVVAESPTAVSSTGTPMAAKGFVLGTGISKQASSALSPPPLKVCVKMDETGKRTRIVEGIADMPTELNIRESKKTGEVAVSSRKRRHRLIKTRKQRSSLESKGKEADDSWEDMSSEEDVSFVADLPGPSSTVAQPQTSKCVDFSSGPESLDPIPPTSKEEELLWEEFHPAGFQNNMTLAMVKETAYQALLSKGDPEREEGEEQGKSGIIADGNEAVTNEPDESSTKLDPILVVTQIVQAEVDCMSLTSLTTDSSLPDEINVPLKTEPQPEPVNVSAEELSGPVSILEVPAAKEEASSDSEGSFLSADSPKSQILGEEKKTHQEIECKDETMTIKSSGEILSDDSCRKGSSDVNLNQEDKDVPEEIEQNTFLDSEDTIAEDERSDETPNGGEILTDVGQTVNGDSTNANSVSDTEKEFDIKCSGSELNCEQDLNIIDSGRSSDNKVKSRETDVMNAEQTLDFDQTEGGADVITTKNAVSSESESSKVTS